MSEERPRETDDREAHPPTPLWVKLFGGVALAVVLLFVILLLVGSGHGPWRHAAADPHEHAQTSGTTHAPLDR